MATIGNSFIYDKDEARILSRPFRIDWAGWESNTLRLQQAGWKLAVRQEFYNDSYQLLIRNDDMNLTAISSSLQIQQAVMYRGYDLERIPCFRMKQAACRLESRTVDVDLGAFVQIDAQPCVTTADIKRESDFNIFNIPLRRGEEVMIESANMSVIEHLEAIKSLQSDKQKEIRARIIDESKYGQGVALAENNALPASDVVVSLVEYREQRG